MFLSSEVFGIGVYAGLVFEGVLWLVGKIVENVAGVMVEELTKRYHGDTFEIASEAPADQMYVDPSIVVFSYVLHRYYLVLLHHQLELLPFPLEKPQ